MSDEKIELEEDEYTSQFTGETFKRILGLLRPHWKWALGFVVAILLTAVVDSVFTYINLQIIDDGIIPSDTSVLLRLALIYVAFVLLQSTSIFTFISLAGALGERIQYDLRQSMFNHLQDLSLSYYSQTSVGRMIARVTSDTGRVSNLMSWGVVDITWSSVAILTSTAFMFYINWQMALVVFLSIPLLMFIAIQFRKRILVEFRNSRRANSKITGAYNENIQGVRVVKALGREAENLNEFQTLTDQMYHASYRAAWLSALFLPAVQIISSIALGYIVWQGGVQSAAGNITIGGIQAFVTYLMMMMWPVQELARVYAEMQHSISSAERIFKMLDTPPEIVDQPSAVVAETLQGEIEFDHVHFHYGDAKDKPVLQDFTLKVKPGETIALVGPTGGGKSTIVNLLCRFYEPTQGVVRINGRDYTEYTLQSIQSRLGIVLQTPHLFSGNIRENIRYGRLDASDAEVEAAAQLSGAHDFIVSFEKGYGQEVGEGGNQLSVGQKQLISLARAILARPEIFIMDEATSSVDTLTEALIQRGMENLMKGRTSFIIAHALSTIRSADRILVIGKRAHRRNWHTRRVVAPARSLLPAVCQQFKQEREKTYTAAAMLPVIK